MKNDIRGNAEYLKTIETSNDTPAQDKEMIQSLIKGFLLLLEQLPVGELGQRNLRGKIISSYCKLCSCGYR